MTEHRSGRRVVALVTAVGLALTVLATVAAARAATAQHDVRFGSVTRQAGTAVEERLGRVTATALTLRNALLVEGGVTAESFEQHYRLDDADRLLTDVRAMSLVRAVPAADVATYEAEVAERVPGFTVRPPSTVHDDRFVVELLHPLVGNEQALGFDLGSEPIRRAAVETARDRGEPAATAPIKLVQESVEGRAVLLIVPLYATDEVPVTTPARRRHFTGAVTAVVPMADLLAGVLGPRPRLEHVLVDVGESELGGPATPRTVEDDDVLFASRPALVASALEHVTAGTAPETGAVVDVNVAGRRWRLVAWPTPGFDGVAGLVPWLVALIGVVITGGLVVTTSSISGARERAERIARDRTAELSGLLEHAPDATIVVDEDGTISLATAQVESLLGYAPTELVGRAVEELVPPDDRAAHPVLRAGFHDRGGPAGMALDREVRVLRADGSELDVEISLNPLPSVPDRPARVVASLRDVTQRREAARRLDELNEQKTVFLRTVSHELRTPLTSIAGFVDVLRRGGTRISEDDRDDYLRRIERNAENLRRLIQDVIDFASLERDDPRLHHEELDLSELVTDVVSQLGPILARHEVEVAVRDGVRVVADRQAVTRVLSNLLTNAARYSPPGTTVTVRTGVAEGVGLLLVDDQGPGVPEDQRELVFERFWRGDGDHVTGVGGSGVGLAVVRQLVELQGGDVTVTAAPDGGARFRVRLPAAREAAVGDADR